MDNFVKLIEAIAWPAAAVWLGYMFRGELRQLLTRMSHFKYKDVEAKFEKELKHAETATDKVIKAVPRELGEEPRDRIEEAYLQLSRILEVSPRAAIMEAWIQIETALAKLAGVSKDRMRGLSHGKAVLGTLIDENKLPQDSIDAFQSLRKIRNEAAHLPDFAISQNEAERYIDMAVKIAGAIDYYARRVNLVVKTKNEK